VLSFSIKCLSWKAQLSPVGIASKAWVNVYVKNQDSGDYVYLFKTVNDSTIIKYNFSLKDHKSTNNILNDLFKTSGGNYTDIEFKIEIENIQVGSEIFQFDCSIDYFKATVIYDTLPRQ
jgi:hypothetical protein